MLNVAISWLHVTVFGDRHRFDRKFDYYGQIKLILDRARAKFLCLNIVRDRRI